MSKKTLLMGETGAASIIGVSVCTLQKYRTNGRGPKFFKEGRRVFYRRSDIVAWVDSRTMLPSTGVGEPVQFGSVVDPAPGRDIPKLVTRAEFARDAGVSGPTISRATKGRGALVEAVHATGRWIDRNHPVAVAYVEARACG